MFTCVICWYVSHSHMLALVQAGHLPLPQIEVTSYPIDYSSLSTWVFSPPPSLPCHLSPEVFHPDKSSFYRIIFFPCKKENPTKGYYYLLKPVIIHSNDLVHFPDTAHSPSLVWDCYPPTPTGEWFPRYARLSHWFSPFVPHSRHTNYIIDTRGETQTQQNIACSWFPFYSPTISYIM